MTPAERQLAERPQPDGYFRELTGYWHGVPGLEALKARWDGFAKEHPGFAVLAALLSESEGKPEEALDKVQRLPGSGARWNEGRLLALLGRENDAVAVLTALAAAEGPELGAAALIALTELDCIRGDFAGALRRTAAAWETRKEEAFRLRILERHLSLLVEAGRERGFVEDQVKVAEATGDEDSAGTAHRVLAVMADWFTEDVRLKEARERLSASARDGSATDTSLLFSFDPDAAAPPAPPHEFKTAMVFQSMEPLRLPEAIAIYAGRNTAGTFYGILNADGRILTLETAPEAPKQRERLVPQRFLTSTSIACFPATDRQIPVLDWADGTLRLRHVSKIPPATLPSPGRSSLHLSHENVLTDSSLDPPEIWLSPLRLSKIQSISEDRAIGRTSSSDGIACSIVLLRKIRTVP